MPENLRLGRQVVGEIPGVFTANERVKYLTNGHVPPILPTLGELFTRESQSVKFEKRLNKRNALLDSVKAQQEKHRNLVFQQAVANAMLGM